MADHASRDNWYLHVNVWDPHTPYRAPASFGEPFKDAPLPGWLTDEVIAQHVKMVGPHGAMEISMYDDSEMARFPRHPGKVTDRASLRKMIDGYDTGVLYADRVVGRIVEELKKAGVYEETAIIVSADHGENLGELGMYAEHGTADAITCRVPLVVKWPASLRGKRGAVDSGLHYNLDLAPTLMELLGGEAPGIWDGVSFAGAIVGGNTKAQGSHPPPSLGLGGGREELVISQCCHVCQRSVRWGNWLYMRTYHDGFHLFPQEMLFDVAKDPHEQRDLAGTRAEVCREGAWRLLRWHDGQMQKMAVTCSDVVDPLWTVIFEGGPLHALHDPGRSPLPKYLARLEATGRGEGAKALRAKYAAFLPRE
jgi:arylsulfatase A-like enzyme